MKKINLFLIICVALFVTGCASNQINDNNESINYSPLILLNQTNQTTQEPANETETPQEIEPITQPVQTTDDDSLVFTEGDLIRLIPPRVDDPDGDAVQLIFGQPFNQDGLWQTSFGDAGNYNVSITATDGRLSTIRTIKITVLPGNRPPQISGLSNIVVQETETVRLTFDVFDPDENDTVDYTISGWMTSRERATDFGDAGVYDVTVSVTDGTHVVEESITVIVERRNRPPVLEFQTPVTVTEGELITLNVTATDPDGDDVTITFPQPFNQNGEWQTQRTDAGTYAVTIRASDGQAQVQETITVRVLQFNTPPVIEMADELTVFEGDFVTLNHTIFDPDGDELIITYSGYTTTREFFVPHGDAGEHQIVIRASDGRDVTTHTVNLTIIQVNRPPVFIGDIRVERVIDE